MQIPLQISLHGIQHSDALNVIREKTEKRERYYAGRVARIDAAAGIGFIATDGGREYYFSRDNVVMPPFRRSA